MKSNYFLIVITLFIFGCSDTTHSLITYSAGNWDEYDGYFITHNDGSFELVNHGKVLSFRNNALSAEMSFKHGELLYNCAYYENGNKRFEYFYDKEPQKGVFYDKSGEKILETFFINGKGLDFYFNEQGELKKIYLATEGEWKNILSINK